MLVRRDGGIIVKEVSGDTAAHSLCNSVNALSELTEYKPAAAMKMFSDPVMIVDHDWSHPLKSFPLAQV